MKVLLFKSFLGFVFVHIFFWVVHRSEVSIILLLDHHPICLNMEEIIQPLHAFAIEQLILGPCMHGHIYVATIPMLFGQRGCT
jgi:hypothetical protein